MEGALCKWTNVVKGWQYRYFKLDPNQSLLSYYTSKDKMVKGDRHGCVYLEGAVIGIDTEDDSTFTITVDSKMFHFQAHDSEDRMKWVAALENAIIPPTKRRKIKRHLQVISFDELEKKVTETDIYLQLLIKQIKGLDQKIENISVEEDKQKLVDIKASLLTLLDSIKHTIVLLQIAKKNTLLQNTVNPINGVINLGKTNEQTSNTKVVSNEKNSLSPKLNESIEKLSINSVPEMSYSSSDDNESFYDAPEETISTEVTSKTLESSTFSTDMSTNFDAYYEDDDEEDIGNIANHGSVISHLISQVKIGMDLTKVELPAFILERRSLLEMYADFFAHPDLFISIPEYETPESRFIAVVRWYLSAFHAGRKTSVAKKPYNPVLGEMFKCFWEIPNQERMRLLAEDGPIPWAKTNDLTFVAEQVSHHPPISAFYAEHIDKKIMCSAHIYTKSSFLGLSIGVHNIGQGSIYLLDKGEEYVVTFPSAYGRSILTRPWIELGGKVRVSCAQSGYNAHIEFITKPFYGGHKHQIAGEILNPNKKTILTISGEWNGVMYVRYNNCKDEVFVDTKAMKIVKKIVKPICEQENYESRCLWKEVTKALKLHDMNTAKSAKSSIEQAQREAVKKRQESNAKWKSRMFHSLGDHWYFNNPLTQRLPKG